MSGRNAVGKDSVRIRKLAESKKVRFIHLQFVDITGTVRSVTVPVRVLPDLLNGGIWFDGSSVEGFVDIEGSDMFLKPDLSTFALIPWEGSENPTARFICNVNGPDGKPFAGDPRQVLIRVLGEAEKMGFRFVTAPECEFFLLKTENQGTVHNGTVPDFPVPADQADYFDYGTDLGHDVRKEIVNALQELGIEVEASHHEVAVGQHEIDFKYGPALLTADRTVTFRTAVKAVARRHGLYATFMPKPVFGINGSGMHCNQSLFSVRTGHNAFYDRREEHGLSKVCRHFLAGQLAHARGMCAILSPLVNSYKRLVPGYEAPVYIAWGRNNRSALIRIPQFSPEHTEAARVEFRSADPSCNPYLAYAVLLECGLDGIRRELEPPAPTDANLYHLDPAKRGRIAVLPGSLDEALDELEQDEVVRTALGPHVFQSFVESKRREFDAYRMQVTPWEIQQYLPKY